MADKTIRCKVITPEARVFDAPVKYARVPMWDGEAGVMHSTSAIVGKLGFGELRLDLPDGATKSWFIAGGFMQNVSDNLTILAAGATSKEKLDASEVKAELAEANARKSLEPQERERIDEDAAKARAKLNMLSRR